jgi:hypothetical protein
MPERSVTLMYAPLAAPEAHLFRLLVHDEDFLTQQWGEILLKQWQNVTQKVGKVVSHFLLRI